MVAWAGQMSVEGALSGTLWSPVRGPGTARPGQERSWYGARV
jgi:hypothetical protein